MFSFRFLVFLCNETAVSCFFGTFYAKRIPRLAEEEWRDSLLEAVAPGAKREPARSASAIARSLKRSTKPQLMVSSAKRVSRSDHPVCAFASLGASTPPLRGGEWPSTHTSQ